MSTAVHGFTRPEWLAPVAGLNAFRRGMRRGDTTRVEAHWVGPRIDGEEDLFSEAARRDGLDAAIVRVAPFWRGAHEMLESVRHVDDSEAEVYERVALRSEALSVVTLLRRDAEDSWKVVSSRRAPDDRFRIWLTCTRDALRERAWLDLVEAELGERPALVREGSIAVLTHPMSGPLVVRGPFVPEQWPEYVPGPAALMLELSARLPHESRARVEQLGWIVRVAHSLLETHGGSAGLLPFHRKLILPRPLRAATEGRLDSRGLFNFWARLRQVDGYLVSSGLEQLALPEVEVSLGAFGQRRAQAIVRELGAQVVASRGALGPTVVVGDGRYQVIPGRRGPRAGESYGRWGSVGVAPA